MNKLLFHMRSVEKWNFVAHEYCDGSNRIKGRLTLHYRSCTRVIELVGALDEHWLREVGFDEVRIVKSEGASASQWEFAGSELELWSANHLGASFPLDSFSVSESSV